jgi:hypothetical protein
MWILEFVPLTVGTLPGYYSCHLGDAPVELLSYADYMSEKNADREAFGPRVAKKLSPRHEMKFRVDKVLFAKLGGLAEIETRVARHDDPSIKSISDNAQLHHILEEFIARYEKKYGALPSADDEEGIARQVRARTK